jgi:adenylate cyclase
MDAGALHEDSLMADDPLVLRTARRLAALGDVPTDDDDLLMRKHAFVIATMGMIAASLLWAVAAHAFGHSLLALASITFAAAATAGVLAYGVTKRYCWSVRALLVLGMVYVVIGHISLGGFRGGGGSLTWGLLAPVLAALLFDVSSGFRWLAVYGAAVVALVVVDAGVVGLMPYPSDAMPVVILAYNLLGPTLVVVLLTAAVDGERAMARSDYQRLLHEMVPSSVARQLTLGQHRVAERHASVSVVFADLVNFTSFAARTKADDVLLVLNDVFNTFDGLADRFGVEKVKTLGDGYMAVAGAPVSRDDHADAAVRFAVALHHAVARRMATRSRGLRLRVGIASGPATAGIIGRRRLAYDLWGDTVNLASRMESTGVPGLIQVSRETARLTRAPYPFEPRTGVLVRGKGRVSTYLLDPTRVPDPLVIPRTTRTSPASPDVAGERPGVDVPVDAQPLDPVGSLPNRAAPYST